MLFGSFFLAIVALVVLKLFIATVILGHPHAIAEFKGQLLWRTSEDRVGGSRLAAAAALFAKLLGEAPGVFLLGSYGALVAYCLGAVCWLAALCMAARRCAGSHDATAAIRFLVPLLAAAVVPAWFFLFLSHGFIHAWFMTRIGCLVPGIGAAAAWLAFSRPGRAAPPALPSSR